MIFKRGVLIPLFVFFAFLFYFPFLLLFVPFFLIPIFYSNNYNLQHPFKTGWLCGTLFFTIHMFGFWWVAFQSGVGLLRIIYPLLLFMYCGLYTGLWFYLLSKMRFVSVWYKRGGRLLVTFLYFWFVHSGIFFIFGSWEGYRLACPLVPFVNLLYRQALQKKGRFKNIVTLPLVKKEAPYEMAQSICLQLIEAAHKNPQAKLFVLPESAFPFVLTEHRYALTMWHTNVLGNDKYLILGSHSRIDENLYNSFILVSQCRITQCYHKKHLVPFFEQIPQFFQSFTSFANLFLSQKEQFKCGKSDRNPFNSDSFRFIPVVCSELFFSSFNKDEPKTSLLCLMNDSYFKGSGYSKIMLNYANYLSVIQKREMIYVSSEFSCSLMKD